MHQTNLHSEQKGMTGRLKDRLAFPLYSCPATYDFQQRPQGLVRPHTCQLEREGENTNTQRQMTLATGGSFRFRKRHLESATVGTRNKKTDNSDSAELTNIKNIEQKQTFDGAMIGGHDTPPAQLDDQTNRAQKFRYQTQIHPASMAL